MPLPWSMLDDRRYDPLPAREPREAREAPPPPPVTYRIFRTFAERDGFFQSSWEELNMDDHRESKPMGQVIHIDEARIGDHLGEMVRSTVEDALNAMLVRRGGPAVRRQPLPAQPGQEGHPRRPLRAVTAHQGRQGQPEAAEAAPPDLRNGHHRTLSAAREQRRGSVEEASRKR